MALQNIDMDTACRKICDGDCIIYPTETFYALGCSALNPDAIGKIFSVKKRDLSLPLPVIVSDRAELELLVAFIPDTAQKLMEKFWPGALSIIFPARPEVPDLLTAGKGRVAVRCSSHPVAAALAKQSGVPLVASSANISGKPPVSEASALDANLLQQVPFVCDIPPAPPGGLPSTVVDIVPGVGGEVLRICRSGSVSLEDLTNAGFTAEVCHCPDSSMDIQRKR